MFELLPGTGVLLPHDAGLLRFGMSKDACQWAVSTLEDVQNCWLCGARWALTARYEGIELMAWGDTVGHHGGSETVGLDGVVLSRQPYTATAPSVVPVVLAGIDLFGHPADEVREALDLTRFGDVRVESMSPTGYLAEVRISATPG